MGIGAKESKVDQTNTALLDRRAQLWRMVAQLNLDETEAIMSFVAKLLEGKDKHGALDLATDARDWDEEIRQEMVDAAFYAVFKSIQRSRRRAKAGPVVAGLRELREAEQIAPTGGDLLLKWIDTPEGDDGR